MSSIKLVECSETRRERDVFDLEKKGGIREVYKVEIAEQDKNYEEKIRENDILAQFSIHSGLGVRNEKWLPRV